MRVYAVKRDGNTTEYESLSEAMGIAEAVRNNPSYVVSVCGAGGKTNTVFTLARELGEKGLRAAVTTTTHMMEDPVHGIVLKAQDVFPDPLPWKEHPYLFAAREMVPQKVAGKTQALLPEELVQLEKASDVVIIEADGARRMPFKVPGEKEPVIPEETDHLVIVMGLSALDRPIEEVTFRADGLCAILACKPQDPLTIDKAVQALCASYIRPLKSAFPQIPITVLCNQADEEARIRSGKQIAAGIHTIIEDQISVLLTTREKEERI